MPKKYDYDVALSFAGEDRHYVAPIAEQLKSRGVSVFYDEFEQVNLWGKDLYEHLDSIYSKRARFCVAFLSEHYAAKAWTTHERKSAQARAFQQNEEYVLPIRLDETEIPGIRPTVGYLNYHSATPEQIVDRILEKLDHSARAATENVQSAPFTLPGKIRVPRIRKSFTERERDLFLQQAFAFVMNYFQEALRELEASDPDVETEFLPLHRQKFACKVYVKGEVAQQCKIWLGGAWGGHGSASINYFAGKRINLDEDNSHNESISVTDDGYQLLLDLQRSGLSGFGKVARDEAPALKEAAAEHLWERFSEQLGS